MGEIHQKKHNSMKKILILFLLLVLNTGNSVNFKNLSNADKEKEIVSKNNYDSKSDEVLLNIDMQVVRILSDANINTWTTFGQTINFIFIKWRFRGCLGK